MGILPTRFCRHRKPDFKQRFYPCRWAQYENARPGSFRLIPPENHLPELRKDYLDMGVMIFEEIPDFESIIKTLSQLENQINELGVHKTVD